MSRIKISGFSQASAVAITVAMGTQQASATVPFWKMDQPTNKSVSIEATDTSGPAPLGVFFRAVVSGFNLSDEEAEHELDYIWDLGATNSASQALTVRSTSFWNNNTNVSYLPRVSQTYTNLGPQTAQVWVSDGSDIVTATVTIDPLDPDAVFGGVRTIYVDANGTLDTQHNGAPAGASYVTTTTQALSKWREFDSAGGRILFAANQTHAAFPDQFTSAKHIAIGRYGIGAKPVIDCTGADGVRPTEHVLSFRCAGLHLQGNWNAATETGSKRDGIAGNVNVATVVHNCSFDGLGTAIQFNAAATDTNWHAQISGCTITNWQNYGILLPRPLLLGLVGNDIRQKTTARGGGVGKAVSSNHHGPVRTSAPRRSGWTCVRMNELFSNSSWTTANNRPSHQPTFRWNSAGVKDATALFERNIQEGGRQVMSFDPGSSGATGERNNIIYQMNVLIGSANSADSLINLAMLGVTIRNNMFLHPDVAAEDENNLAPPITITSNYADTDHQYARCDIYSNTYIDQRSNVSATKPGNTNPSNLRLLKDGNPANLPPNARIVNNVIYGPNRTPPSTAQGPMDDTVLFAPYYLGRYWQGEPALDASFASPANTIITAIPLVALPAPQSPPFAMRDLSGKLRPTTTHDHMIGARQTML